MSQNVLIEVNGTKLWASARQAETLERLKETRKGGVATVKGYRPTTNYVTPPVKDMQILTRFSTERCYERFIMGVEAVTFDMVKPKLSKNPKLAALTEADAIKAFNERKAYILEAKRKSLAGERDTAQHEAHDRNYVNVTEGVKIHLVTEKNADGIMVPVKRDGFPMLASIMLSALVLNETTVTEGVRKPAPNSGVPVLMGNLIEGFLNDRSTGFRTIKLGEDNFDSVKIDRQTLTEADISTEPLHRVV